MLFGGILMNQRQPDLLYLNDDANAFSYPDPTNGRYLWQLRNTRDQQFSLSIYPLRLYTILSRDPYDSQGHKIGSFEPEVK